MDVGSALLVAYVVLSLALPYALSGDRSMTTFFTYVFLTLLAVATALARLKRWEKVE